MSDPIYAKLLKLEVRSEIIFNQSPCGDWTLEEPLQKPTCFHFVKEGQCLLNIENKTIIAKKGDFIIFTKFIRHAIKPLPQCADQPHICCGVYKAKNSITNCVLQQLPDVLIFNSDADLPCTAELISLFNYESTLGDGNDSDAPEICDLIIKKAIRSAYKSIESSNRIAVDPRILKAIHLIQAQPEIEWTLNKLAVASNMSRTSLAEGFNKALGTSPMKYIAEWRMSLAWNFLSDGLDTLSTANQVGYSSESAFSKAFLQHHRIRPGKVKKIT